MPNRASAIPSQQLRAWRHYGSRKSLSLRSAALPSPILPVSASMPAKLALVATRCRYRCVLEAPEHIVSIGACSPSTRIGLTAVSLFASASNAAGNPMDWLGAAIDGPLVAIRAMHFSSTAITAGAFIFQAVVAEPALRSTTAATTVLRQQIRLGASIGFAIASATGVVWFQLQAAAISWLPFGECLTSDVLSTVLNETQFGLVSKVRLVLAGLLGTCLAIYRFAQASWLALGSAVGFIA